MGILKTEHYSAQIKFSPHHIFIHHSAYPLHPENSVSNCTAAVAQCHHQCKFN